MYFIFVFRERGLADTSSTGLSCDFRFCLLKHDLFPSVLNTIFSIYRPILSQFFSKNENIREALKKWVTVWLVVFLFFLPYIIIHLIFWGLEFVGWSNTLFVLVIIGSGKIVMAISNCLIESVITLIGWSSNNNLIAVVK